MGPKCIAIGKLYYNLGSAGWLGFVLQEKGLSG